MSSAFFLRSTRAAVRRRNALGAGIGLSLCSGAMLLRRPGVVLMDAHAAPRTVEVPVQTSRGSSLSLDPVLMRQLSGGSVTGFIAGLLVSVFSKTLTLLIGTGIVLIQIASRYGIDIVGQLKLKERVKNSKVLAALQSDPAFKVSFGLFFAMSAFASF